MNEQGNVANEVETEQIIYETGVSDLERSCLSSFVQLRGSIPLFWTQESASMTPKPPISLKFRDSFYKATSRHFDDLIGRYGFPIVILNLVKQMEKTKRESILLEELDCALNYLCQFLEKKESILHIKFDMARESKKKVNVLETLELLIRSKMNEIEPFCMQAHGVISCIQQGIVRTNCVDCLDRTNAAQFVIGKIALEMQLKKLRIIDEDAELNSECEAVILLTRMFHDHGDTIALQYGGSNLVNTVESYRNTEQSNYLYWSSHSRDLINTIKRFYSNSFTDGEKQDAINVFLGIYRPANKLHLWELSNDFSLHNNSQDYEDVKEWKVAKAPEFNLSKVTFDKKLFWMEIYKENKMTSFKTFFPFYILNTPRLSLSQTALTKKSIETEQIPSSLSSFDDEDWENCYDFLFEDKSKEYEKYMMQFEECWQANEVKADHEGHEQHEPIVSQRDYEIYVKQVEEKNVNYYQRWIRNKIK